MNRNFISLIIAVLFSSASFAQQYEYKLTGITSKHTNDYYKYFYDDANGRVDSAVQYRELAGFIYDYTLKYIYDENGNEPVRVYSQTGVLMDMKKYNSQEGISISSMPAGAYIISTRQGSVKVWNR